MSVCSIARFIIHFFPLEAAIVNIFVSKMDNLTVCESNWTVAMTNPQRIITGFCSFPQPQRTLKAYFSSLFWFYDPQLYCFGSLIALICVVSLASSRNPMDWRLRYLLSIKQQTKLENIVEHLAAEGTDTSPQELVES